MRSFRRFTLFVAIILSLLVWGCEFHNTRGPSNAASPTNANSAGNRNSTAQAPAAHANDWAVTLPVIEAFLADEEFVKDLESELNLTAEQIAALKATSRDATAQLRTGGREENETGFGSSELRREAETRIGGVIGAEKSKQLFAFVAKRWSGEDFQGLTFGGIPTDSRVVINAPAFRMDVFENGRLIKSYLIGIGYPEFPLPIGLRKADQIIFNPTWTPPDEPWVSRSYSKVQPGKTVEAGSKLNPLGALKVPIGLPSLIHGGKQPAKLGTFASHGCVGLTDAQALDFGRLLARIGGKELTDQEISQYLKNRTETRVVKLPNPVPVELRYETIFVENGTLRIYRDVYDRDTNTEENLRAVLSANGVSLEQLSDQERPQILAALQPMSRDATGRLDSTNDNSNRTSKSKRSSPVTRSIKGPKEASFQLPVLIGKGYPAAENLDTGIQPRAAGNPRRRSR